MEEKLKAANSKTHRNLHFQGKQKWSTIIVEIWVKRKREGAVLFFKEYREITKQLFPHFQIFHTCYTQTLRQQ